jgi:hypothetical protein
VKQLFRLAHHIARQKAIEAIRTAPEGHVVTLKAPTRSLEQNAKFHAICSDLAKSGLTWAGEPRTAEQWKVLLVSAHAKATKQGSEMVLGLEGEFVNLRESTAAMDKARGASLIEYAQAFCEQNSVYTKFTEFMENSQTS